MIHERLKKERDIVQPSRPIKLLCESPVTDNPPIYDARHCAQDE